MNFSSAGSIIGAYQYAMYAEKGRTKEGTIQKTNSDSFTDCLADVKMSGEERIEAYTEHLRLKYGNVMVLNVGKDQKSMDNFAAGTMGTANVAIAPNILEQMASDPEKAKYYEKKIQEHFDSLPATMAFMSAIGHRITACGVVIHEDGTATYYLSGEESPEKKAKFEAEQKAKQEKKAKQRKENLEHNRKVYEERRRIEEESYQKMNMETFLYSQMLHSGRFAFADMPEKMMTAYESGFISTSIFNLR